MVSGNVSQECMYTVLQPWRVVCVVYHGDDRDGVVVAVEQLLSERCALSGGRGGLVSRQICVVYPHLTSSQE